MTRDSADVAGDDLSIEAIKRTDALEVLDDGPVTRAELMDSLDVSRTTVHRLVQGLEEFDLLVDDGGELSLSPLGREIRHATETYRDTVRATLHLEPLFTSLGECDVEFDVHTFADATVTVAERGNPYGPINRFTTLLAETTSLRGFDTTSVSPTYVEDVHDMILDGMCVEVVYDYGIVDQLATEYADLASDTFDRDNLVLRVHEEVPFGLALFDDRVGIGGYDDETGLLRVFVDTDDPAAIEWGERLFESYWDESTPV